MVLFYRQRAFKHPLSTIFWVLIMTLSSEVSNKMMILTMLWFGIGVADAFVWEFAPIPFPWANEILALAIFVIGVLISENQISKIRDKIVKLEEEFIRSTS